MHDWIAHLFRDKDMLRMGHGQRVEDRNLGLGWVYYALARLLRPEKVVVIGSYRGFAPLVRCTTTVGAARSGSSIRRSPMTSGNNRAPLPRTLPGSA